MPVRGSTPRLFTLSLRSQPERGGEPLTTVNDKDGLERDTAWRHLLILVHGFNNAESVAEEKYDHYVDILRPFLEDSRIAPDAIAKLHWPGNAAVGPFPIFDFAGYPVDVGRALQSVGPLAVFLQRLMATRPSTRRISVVGHSLGCRLIVEAMNRLAPGLRLAVVSLMAAAVPVALAEAGQPLANALAAATKMLIAHSRADWVLFLAFPAGQALAAIAGIEQAAYVEAIGRNGNPVSFGASLPRPNNGHGDYWTDEYAAAMLLQTMDATLRVLPPAAALPRRALLPTENIASRAPKSRNLPT